VAAGLEQAYPEHLRGLASFATGDARDLRLRLGRLLALDSGDRAAIAAAARAAVVERWSWAGVSSRLLELAAPGRGARAGHGPAPTADGGLRPPSAFRIEEMG
jgi:hypothetical protein